MRSPSSKDFRVEGLQELDLRQLATMPIPISDEESENRDERQEDSEETSEEGDPMKVETSEEE